MTNTAPYSNGPIFAVNREPDRGGAVNRVLRSALAPAFLILSAVAAQILTPASPMSMIVVIGAAIAAYMAINIGANDVANNVSVAVGSGALTLPAAIVIAVAFEAAGAIIAGGDVVSTVSKGIIDPTRIGDPQTFVLAMASALLAAGLWLNIATWLGAPVSTTHSIVGAVLGGGVAAAGFSAVNWPTMAGIAASWVISPLMGGLVAAGFYAAIRATTLTRADKVAASRTWAPVFVAIMAGAFSIYLTQKGLSKLWKPDSATVGLLGLGAFVITLLVVRPLVARASLRCADVQRLFNIPLACSAALLCFAHGANDVANAVGPLAAIVDAAQTAAISPKAAVPLWVMLIGAVGLSIGVALFGAQLVRKVGSKLTSLDQTRAFCAALSAAVTVIGASALGLPVSSTHIAIGAIFGIGLYREEVCNRGLSASGVALMGLSQRAQQPRIRRRKLFRRGEPFGIAAAWIVTVPAVAALSAALYTLADGVLDGGGL